MFNKSSIQIKKLMNAFRPYPNIDIYISICNKQLSLINSTGFIIGKSQINYDLYPGYKNPQYNSGKQCINEGYLYKPVICKGKIYIQVFERVYSIKNCALQLEATIPDFNMYAGRYVVDANYCSLFVIDDDLYALNFNERVYVLNNDKFKFVKHMHGQAHQFYNKVYLVRPFLNLIQQIGSNLQPVHNFELNAGISQQFIFGEILAVVTQKPVQAYSKTMITELHVINIFDNSHKVIEFSKQYQKLGDQLVLGSVGLQLKDEILNTLYQGTDKYSVQIQREYQQFINRQINTFPQYSHEVNKVLNLFQSNFPNLLLQQYNQQKNMQQRRVVQYYNILNNVQLLNLVTLTQFKDIFAVVEDNFIYIINQQKQVIKQIEVDYNVYQGVKQASICYGNEVQIHAQLHNVVFCANKVYLQYYNKILELTPNLELKYAFIIPDLNMNTQESFICRLFTLNNQLYVHNYDGSSEYQGNVYVFDGKQLTFVMQQSGYFVQSRESVVIWDHRANKLLLLSPDLQVTLIRDIMNYTHISLASGVLILQLMQSQGNKLLCVDLNTRQIVEKTCQPGQDIQLNTNFDNERIISQLDLGSNRRLKSESYQFIFNKIQHEIETPPFRINDFETIKSIFAFKLSEFYLKLEEKTVFVHKQTGKVANLVQKQMNESAKISQNFIFAFGDGIDQ
ncbi:Conserved_hypothetical protein [Hexamita inflata]|uniref:Uncharacterized protein n=1 Tax=Hexamita inflata TaxID=28002 RepID=A0AA86UN49_9EUKA|nr:Conserved hypothetical protein [Hexamita inflata]